MCGRYSQVRAWSDLVRLYRITAPATPLNLPPRYNIAPTQDVPVVRSTREGGSRELVLLRWGLVPFWAKDIAGGYKMINARAESVFTSPAFRNSIRRKRCLIPADGFYEWRQPPPPPEGAKARKQPYLIHRLDGQPLALAGIWSTWKEPESGEWLRSCAIVTTTPNQLMARIHDRMPVILPEAAWDRWLDPTLDDVDELRGLLVPYVADELEAYPVSTLVNNTRNESPDLTAPIPGEVLHA
jgi:putative SOS response-associated peptidase YedK